MRIKFPYLMALAHRMAPGVFEDPKRIIGTCLYCDREVTYAAGDLHPNGMARHDECESAAMRRQLAGPRSRILFMHALGILRELPSVKPSVRAAIETLPEKFGPREMARIIEEALPLVKMEGTLPLKSRLDTIVALRSVKRDLLGLEAA